MRSFLILAIAIKIHAFASKSNGDGVAISILNTYKIMYAMDLNISTVFFRCMHQDGATSRRNFVKKMLVICVIINANSAFSANLQIFAAGLWTGFDSPSYSNHSLALFPAAVVITTFIFLLCLDIFEYKYLSISFIRFFADWLLVVIAICFCIRFTKTFRLLSILYLGCMFRSAITLRVLSHIFI